MTLNQYTAKEIQQKVYTVVSDLTGMEISSLHSDLSISEDIAPSSLDRVTLFMALEDELSRSIAEEELKGIETLGDLLSFVEREARKESA